MKRIVGSSCFQFPNLHSQFQCVCDRMLKFDVCIFGFGRCRVQFRISHFQIRCLHFWTLNFGMCQLQRLHVKIGSARSLFRIRLLLFVVLASCKFVICTVVSANHKTETIDNKMVGRWFANLFCVANFVVVSCNRRTQSWSHVWEHNHTAKPPTTQLNVAILQCIATPGQFQNPMFWGGHVEITCFC